jgi:hypothetical protein
MSPVPATADRPWLTELTVLYNLIAYQAPKMAIDKSLGTHSYERWLFNLGDPDANHSIMLLRCAGCWYIKISGQGNRHVEHRQRTEPGPETIRMALSLAGWLLPRALPPDGVGSGAE